MSSTLLAVFETYGKARLAFVTAVAEAATRAASAEPLAEAGALALLRPLLLDAQPAVAHTAALALGRLANYSEELAAAVVAADVLPHLVLSLATDSVSSRASAEGRGALPPSVAHHQPLALALCRAPPLAVAVRRSTRKRRRLLCCGRWPNMTKGWRRRWSRRAHWSR